MTGDSTGVACPRCGEIACIDPDSKGCSDNCITRLRAQLQAAERERDELRDIAAKRGIAIGLLRQRVEVAEREALKYRRLRGELEALNRLKWVRTPAAILAIFDDPQFDLAAQTERNDGRE